MRVAEDTQGGQWTKESTILDTQNNKANRDSKISENTPTGLRVWTRGPNVHKQAQNNGNNNRHVRGAISGD